MMHYRGVQPNPEARKGVAKMPKEMLAARHCCNGWSREVPAKLGAKPAPIDLGHEGFRVPARPVAAADARGVPRSCGGGATRGEAFIQEDAPDRDRRGNHRTIRLSQAASGSP